MNFTAYNWTKDRIDGVYKELTGASPLDEYNRPGSFPTISGLAVFTTAGMAAGLVSSPLACMKRLS